MSTASCCRAAASRPVSPWYPSTNTTQPRGESPGEGPVLSEQEADRGVVVGRRAHREGVPQRRQCRDAEAHVAEGGGGQRPLRRGVGGEAQLHAPAGIGEVRRADHRGSSFTPFYKNRYPYR